MNPFDETCKPYKWEKKFYEENNIPLWECETHETVDLGTIYTGSDGEYVKAKVCPMPTQFWEFEVYSAETGKTTIFKTGSGVLMNYFKAMVNIATGMIVIESQKEQKI